MSSRRLAAAAHRLQGVRLARSDRFHRSHPHHHQVAQRSGQPARERDDRRDVRLVDLDLDAAHRDRSVVVGLDRRGRERQLDCGRCLWRRSRSPHRQRRAAGERRHRRLAGRGAQRALEAGETTLYSAPSGAQVFSAGSIQWSRALANAGNWDRRIQQLVANLFSRFAGDGTLGPAALQPLNLPPGATAPTYRGGVQVATVTTALKRPVAVAAAPGGGALVADQDQIVRVSAAGVVALADSRSRRAATSTSPTPATTPSASSRTARCARSPRASRSRWGSRSRPTAPSSSPTRGAFDCARPPRPPPSPRAPPPPPTPAPTPPPPSRPPPSPPP